MLTWVRCGLFLLAAAATSRGGVIIVDPGGGPGGAALLQAAIDSAQEGDILLLRPGDYASPPGGHPHIYDKGLTLIVDGPPGSVVLYGLWLAGLPGHHLFFRGLHVAPPPLVGFPEGAVVLSWQGTIWFEDCVLTGGVADNQNSATGLAIVCCVFYTRQSQTLVRCRITGGDGADAVPGVSPARAGAPGVALQWSKVTFQECLLQGGKGGDGNPFVGHTAYLAHGGSGLGFSQGSLSILGCTLQGGDEGSHNPAETSPGSGLALNLTDANVRDSEIHAGSVNGYGTPVPDIQATASNLVTFPAALRSLSVPSPLREGEGSVLHLQGEVGDEVWVFLGHSSGLEPMEFMQGDFVLDDLFPSPVIVGAITDASGVLDIAFHAPHLPTGIDGALITLQSAVMPGSGGFVLGSGSALVVIDDTL